ncbi:peptidase S10, serine carboxypeptidase [Chytriomyces sp. MP71]|nr:peptidase S10, serine carboxypeptidase [Chytriomyces sp. MP71]
MPPTLLPTASQFLVTSLPNLTSDFLSLLPNGLYAGYLPTTKETRNPNNYFFLYYPSANVSSNSLTVWLNGGPGCSSLLGAFTENGPILINENGSFSENKYSWHLLSNMLYVEQPVGTGFDVDTMNRTYDEIVVGNEFHAFLDNFYSVFENTKKFNLFITGESYAGTYIPYIAQNLIQAKNLTDGSPINLRGIAIGNGLFDVNAQQGPASTVDNFDFLHESGFLDSYSEEFRTQLSELATKCRAMSSSDEFYLQDGCDLAWYVTEIYNATHSDLGAGNSCFNLYNIDFSAPCVWGSDHLWRQESQLTTLMNNFVIQSALHVGSYLSHLKDTFSWNMCNNINIQPTSYNPPSHELLNVIIKAGIDVVLYDGNRDYVCNYMQVERVISNATWNGARGFQRGPAAWTVSSRNAGLIWAERGLTYIRVFDAGHMLPADQPGSALALFQRILAGAGQSAPVQMTTSQAWKGYINVAIILFGLIFAV